MGNPFGVDLDSMGGHQAPVRPLKKGTMEIRSKDGGKSMFCRNCGKKLEDGWKVCPDCGTKVMADEEQPAEPEIGTVSGQKKKKRILPKIVFFAGVAAVVLILVLFLSDNGKEAKETVEKLAQFTEIESDEVGVQFHYGDIWYLDYTDENEVVRFTSSEAYNCLAECCGTDSFGNDGTFCYDLDDDKIMVYMDYETEDGTISILIYERDSKKYIVHSDGERYNASTELEEYLDGAGFPAMLSDGIDAFAADLREHDLTIEEVSNLNEKKVRRCLKDISLTADSRKGNSTALPGNDLEEFLSCSPGELEQYGFAESDAVEGMFVSPDGSATVLYTDDDLDMMSIESGGQYCFHGIKTGMDMEEAIEAVKSSYSVTYQDEYSAYFINDAGNIMITAASETENGSIERIGVSLDEETIAEQLDILEEAAETEPEETQSPETETELTARKNPMRSEVDTTWPLNYNLFEKEDGEGILSIEIMTDALMNVYHSAGGNYTEWGFGLKPDEIGSDGEYIFYSDDDLKMSYYPDDHHILIDSSDEEYAGYYNYFFDFNGGWSDSTSQRCYMEITCQNDIYYDIDIDWSSSASDHTHWDFLAEYDEEQGCLVYQGGSCIEQHFPDDGSDVQETVVYTDGEGRLYPKDGKLYWEDLKEGAGDRCVFER